MCPHAILQTPTFLGLFRFLTCLFNSGRPLGSAWVSPPCDVVHKCPLDRKLAEDPPPLAPFCQKPQHHATCYCLKTAVSYLVHVGCAKWKDKPRPCHRIMDGVKVLQQRISTSKPPVSPWCWWVSSPGPCDLYWGNIPGKILKSRSGNFEQFWF